MQCLEHGDVIALLGQVAGAGQAGRAGTHHRHLMAVGSGLLGCGGGIRVVPVRHKTLQPADAHGLAVQAPDAVLLALALLRTHPAAHCRQWAGGGDDLICLFKLTLGHLFDELRNPDHDRAALHAGLILAVQAAARLVQRHLFRIPQCDLFKILIANIRLLCGHRILFHTQVCHDYSASFLNRLQTSSCLCISKSRYIWFRFTARSQSTLCPSKSGPSTQANFISPPTLSRQPPHIPVPSIMIGLMETVVGIP